MRRIVFAAVFLVLFVIACAKGTTPADTVGTTGNTDTGTPQAAPQDVAKAEPTVNKGDPEVIKLFDRQPQVKSYSFDVVKFPSKVATATYKVRGDGVRIETVEDIAVADEVMDFIFLNKTAKTATGYCERGGGCDDANQAYSLEYSRFDIVYPHEWIPQIKYGQKVGSLTYDNKPVTRIKYQADGKYYEAYVDNYYGMPQYVAIASDPEMTKIVGGYEYRNMGFNNVKDTDVVHQDVTVR